MSPTPDQLMRRALGASNLNEDTQDAMLELFRLLHDYPGLRVGQAVVSAAREWRGSFACPQVYYLPDRDIEKAAERHRKSSL